MKNKALPTFIVLLAVAVVAAILWVSQLGVLRARADENDVIELRVFSNVFSTLLSFGQSLLSFLLSLRRLVKNKFWSLFFLLTSSVTRTITTTSTIAATTNTLPIGTTSMLFTSDAPVTTSMSPMTTGAATTTSTEPATATSTSSIISTSASVTTSSSSASMSASSSTTTSSSSTTSTTTSTTTTTAPPPSKVVFVTNRFVNGGMDRRLGRGIGGVEEADALCQSSAESAFLSGTFLAWISNSTTSPNDRFVRSMQPYVLVNGTVFSTSYMDLINGLVLSPLNMTEKGDIVSSTNVWTGTNPNGTWIGTSSCREWTFCSIDDIGFYGLSDAVTTSWTSESSLDCDGNARLYCFQQ